MMPSLELILSADKAKFILGKGIVPMMVNSQQLQQTYTLTKRVNTNLFVRQIDVDV